MAKRLGNISKSSFRFLREASLYAYAGVAILGAFYLSYLAFSYQGEITELQPDVRSELIADSQINDLSAEIENVDANIASVTKSLNSAKNTIIPAASQEEKSTQEQVKAPIASASDSESSKNTPKSSNSATKSKDTAPKTSATNTNSVRPTATASTKPKNSQVASNPSRTATNSPASQVSRSTSPPKTQSSTTSTKFQWVLKSFNNPEFASNWVGKFKEMGLSTNVVKASYDGKTWYRVSHGQYSSKEAARADKAKLPKLGDDDYWISSVK